jgi:hypothetical protein
MPQNPARPVLAAPAGARPVPTAGSGHRAIAQEVRDRPQYLPDLRRTRWIIFVPGVSQPAAAARMTLTATAGRVISSTNAATRGPALRGTPVRAIQLCRHDAGDPRFLAVRAIGLFRSRAGSTARRRNPGGLGAGIPDSPRAAIAVAPDGGRGKAGELRLLEWEVAAPQ